MKVLLHSNEESAANATDKTIMALAGQGGIAGGTAYLLRGADEKIVFDQEGWATLICVRPDFMAWALMRQGYVSSVRTTMEEAKEITPTPKFQRVWDDRPGTKSSVLSAITATCENMMRNGLDTPAAQVGNVFFLEAFARNLQELADRFYAGDIGVIDEFLQLYQLDRNRIGQPFTATPRAPIAFIARNRNEFELFCGYNGLDPMATNRLVTEKDIRSIDRETRVYRIEDASLEGDGERCLAARRIHTVPIAITNQTPKP